MYLSAAARRLLGAITALVILFLFAPIAYVFLLAFNKPASIIFSSFSTKWFPVAWHDTDVRTALLGSVKTALAAALIAVVLGTLLSLAVQRYSFFGREALSFLVVLPISLPGIVTGIALNSAFRRILDTKVFGGHPFRAVFGSELGFRTLVVAHATFCIVVVYNNVLARLRRLPGNLDEASADLGARPWQTFWLVTVPLLRSALLAGALLALALSFDEIVVTTFTAGNSFKTLPQFIFENYSRPVDLPIVNVVAMVVVLLSIVPAWLAQRLAGDQAGPAR
jgi:putative spermidine/putrescine transport system permease protein